LTYENLQRDLCVVQGDQTASGYSAYLQIAQQLVLLWPLALLMRIPPIAGYGRNLYRRIADTRHCALLPRAEKEKLAEPVSSAAWIHPVAVTLLVLQLGISAVLFLNDELPAFTARLPWFANRIVVHVSRMKPLWPFAPYPTFAYSTGGEYLIWEARWVLPDREVTVTPYAYSKTFGNSALVWNVVTSYPYDADQQRLRSRSLEMLGALWQNEKPEIRASATGVRVYSVRYQLLSADPPATRLAETLIETFPIDSLAIETSGGASNRASPQRE
jgi:hypothetical protein